eukprot:4043115-Pyramimonas_sp.AAC.1
MAEWRPPPVPRSAQISTVAAAIRSATFTLRWGMGTVPHSPAGHRVGGEYGSLLPSVESRSVVPTFLGRTHGHRSILPCFSAQQECRPVLSSCRGRGD